MTTTAEWTLRDARGSEQETSGTTTKQSARRATASVWAGRVMSGLVVAFLLFASALPKLMLPELTNESMGQLGWNPKHVLLLATIEVVATLLYAVPRTAPLGAVLLTGLFGGAIATHLRIENPLFSHTLFPVWVGLLMWGGLWLRSAALRSFVIDWAMGRSNHR